MECLPVGRNEHKSFGRTYPALILLTVLVSKQNGSIRLNPLYLLLTVVSKISAGLNSRRQFMEQSSINCALI